MNTTKSNVPTFDKYDIKKIEFGPFKKNKQGHGHSMSVSSNQFPHLGKSVVFEINPAEFVYSLKVFKDEKKPNDDNHRLSAHFVLPSKKFITAMKEAEKHLCKYVAERSDDIFFDSFDVNVVQGMLRSAIAKHRNKQTGEKYPDTFRTRCLVNRETGDVQVKFLDGANDNKEINITINNCEREIPYGTKGIAHFRWTKIWFLDKTFGMMFDLTQASVNRPTNLFSLPSIGIADDQTIGRERGEMEVKNEDVESESDGEKINIDEDSEEEEEPPPKPKKNKGKAPVVEPPKKQMKKAKKA